MNFEVNKHYRTRDIKLNSPPKRFLTTRVTRPSREQLEASSVKHSPKWLKQGSTKATGAPLEEEEAEKRAQANVADDKNLDLRKHR